MAFAEGRLKDARSLLANSLRQSIECGLVVLAGRGLSTLAAIAASDGDCRRAALLLAFAEHANEQAGRVPETHHQRTADATRATLEAELDPVELDALWAEGRLLSLEDAVQLVLE